MNKSGNVVVNDSYGIRMLTRYRTAASPLDTLLANENREENEMKMKELEGIMYSKLSVLSVSIVRRFLGRGWAEQYTSPRFLRGLDLDEIESYVEEHLSEIEERLSILVDITSAHYSTIDVKIKEYLSRPYSLMTKNEIIEAYVNSLVDGFVLGDEFFVCDKEKKGVVLTRYLVNNILRIPYDKIIEVAKIDVFKKGKLECMLTNCFNGDVETAIIKSYPREEFPSVYRHEKEDVDKLQQKPKEKKKEGILDSMLKRIFGEE